MKFAPAAALLFALTLTGAAGEKNAQQHWSLRPLEKPAVPQVSADQTNPLDAFILAKLAEKGLTPSPSADRRTIIRRLCYDLTGLPPSPEETDAYLNDPSPDAYQRLLERLLASPQYGEHWARHWLDVAHYADTHGNDHDLARPDAWPYRDYIIRAFNDDKPYPRFVQEQVAGDALFPEDPQATTALGFLAAGPWDDTLMVVVREDTFDHKMAQVLDRDDIVTTVMSTFQSTTVHCARCHDHKFDPVSQADYYALQAVFAGVDRANRPYDTDAATHLRRRDLLGRKRSLARRTPDVMVMLDAPETSAKVRAAEQALADRQQQWTALETVSVTSAAAPDGTNFARLSDGSWRVSGTRPDKDTFIITSLTSLKGIRAIRLEVLPDDSYPFKGPGRYDNGNFHLSEFHASILPLKGETKGAVNLEFARVTADHSDGGDAVANAIDGRRDTWWSIHPRYGEPHEAVFELKQPAAPGGEGDSALTIRLDFYGTTGHQIGRFRLSACTDELNSSLRPPLPAPVAALLRTPSKSLTPEQRLDRTLHLLTAEVENELAALPAPQMVYAVTNDFPSQGSFKPALEPRPIHLLKRGELSKPGELASPGALSCLEGMDSRFQLPDSGDESARRAALARWLTAPHNVLTWRSIVNRVWHYHFGQGLCDTPSDFGRMGSVPSHPELLDWLAVWFRDEAKGSLKQLHRLILTSAAWQRSTASDETAAQLDPANHFLSRGNRRRLTGEELRDSLVQLSGRLELKIGGPSVVQFTDRGKATFNPDGGAPAFLDYDSFSPDNPAHNRRSVYRFIFRTVADPLMDALDVPDGGALTPVRSVSTTPLQAFALLNNALVIRLSEQIAARAAKGADTPEAQVTAAFRLILQRAPSPDELQSFTAYAAKHGLANACNMIVNSNEFIHLD